MMIFVKTQKRTQLIDITSDVNNFTKLEDRSRTLYAYVPHTTAAVTINESADPSVKSDILTVLNQIVPWEANYRHMEGNSPAAR